MHSVKLWDHLPQILRALPPQIIFLYATTPASCPSHPRRPIHHCIFTECFILDRCNHAACSDHAVRRYPQRMVNSGLHANRIPISYARRLDPYRIEQPHQRLWSMTSRECQHSRQPISNRLLSSMRITSLRLNQCSVIRKAGHPCMHKPGFYRLMMTVPSSMIQLFPITTGPVCPKMATFGYTTVPVQVEHKPQPAAGLCGSSFVPCSTSAQVIDFE